MIELKWGTCGNNGAWCDFRKVNLQHPTFDGKEGVFIVWQAKGPIIYIGNGALREKISRFREDPRINLLNNLYVTWAVVEKKEIDGVTSFLNSNLSPALISGGTIKQPVVVNLPWK